MTWKAIAQVLYSLLVILSCAWYALPNEPPLSELKDIPIVEAQSPIAGRTDLAVILSGDGGWAGLCTNMAKILSAEKGIPVVGLNSLRYFLTRRTPEGTAHDIERIIRSYAEVWKKQKVILIGYSFGADVLPFIATRLPEDRKRMVEVVVFISLGSTIDFKFDLSDWIGGKPKPTDIPTVPEVKKLEGMKVLCIYGIDDRDPACTNPGVGKVTVISLKGGHGVGGDARDIIEAVMQVLR